MDPLYSELLGKIITYADGCSDICYLAQIGSQASRQQIADEYSDLDLLLVVKDVKKFFIFEDWLYPFGDLWITFTESVPEANYYERRAIYKNGVEVDFVLIDEAILLQDVNRLPIAREICSQNPVVLLNRNAIGLTVNKLKQEKKPFEFPTPQEFVNLVSDVYFHYLWAYKKLLRGEYWVALRCIDTYLKDRLLTMIEWYEHTRHGADYITFYQGRFLEQWIDPDLAAELALVFSRYDPDEMERTLIRSMNFFTKLAKYTAERNFYPFPEQGRQKLSEWIEKNYVRREK
jgi:aminoglycoside 6-adenylyltransferase